MDRNTLRINPISRPYVVQWLILAFAMLALGGTAVREIMDDRTRIEGGERDRLLTQARVVNENLGRQLLATDSALKGILRDLPGWRAGTRLHPDLTLRMVALEEAIPGVRTIVVVDPQGTILASNRSTLVGFDANARDYFRAVRERPDAERLYVSPPFRTVLGIWSLAVSRMIPGPNGEFAGVITATLDPEYFATLLNSVQYAPDMWAAIAHGDGLQLLMVPERTGQAGKNLAQPGSFFTRHRDSGLEENVLTGIVYATGEERMMALRTIRPRGLVMDKPLVVAVGRNTEAFLTEWKRDVRNQGLVLGTAALGAVLTLAVYQAKARRSERHIAEAREASLRSNERFELLLSSAGEGIYGVDTDGRATFVNPAALAMLGFSKDEVVGQSPHWLFHSSHADGSPYPLAECPIALTLADGLRRELEDHFIRKNGEAFPVHLTVTPMVENGRRVGAEVVFQDIAKRKEMERELVRLATTDPLTEIANRRHFMAQLESELARVRRLQLPASLLMLDVDRFKRVNDRYGHAVGDDVLRHFAAITARRLRRIDIFGRLGGEEFGILLPGTDLAGAAELAEDLRLYLAGHATESRKGPVPFTVSIGVTGLEASDTEPDNVLARADAALYRAKQLGRNRVEITGPPAGLRGDDRQASSNAG